MDEASLTVPAGSRPPAPGRMVAPAQLHCGGRRWLVGPGAARPWRRARRFGPLPLVPVTLAVWLGCSRLLGAAEAYLPYLGPTLLRFAPVPAAHFVWSPAAAGPPVAQPSPAPATKAGTASSASPPFSTTPRSTDLLARPTLEEFLAQPASLSEGGPPLELSAESPPPGSADLVGSPLSASEMLIVTPQMLAEYLKNPPGGTNPPPTQVLPGGELYFRPPITPPAPSSKATYRIQ
jgi:hypothetical protein